MKQTILAVDDEQHILELLEYTLSGEGYTVITAKTGEQALKILHSEKVDLVVLDLMLPDISGLEILKTIRTDPELSDLLVMLLTAKSEEFDRVIGLELGADDYLCKPFFVREFAARIKTILRRCKKNAGQNKQTDILEDSGVALNISKRKVTKNRKIVELTLKEFELLKFFLQNVDKVITRDEIISKIWGYEYIGETRTVDVHVRQLRKKLFNDSSDNQKIVTVRGIGYKWNGD